MRTYDEIADRRVVITGAAGLLGGWITSAFARSGARLLLVDQDGVALEETARSARDAGAAQVEIITVDLSTSAGVKRVAATVPRPRSHSPGLGRTWNVSPRTIRAPGSAPPPSPTGPGSASWAGLTATP